MALTSTITTGTTSSSSYGKFYTTVDPAYFYGNSIINNEFMRYYPAEFKEESKVNKLNSMMKRILDKDTQTLYKAGYLNGDLEMTDKGKKALQGILFDTHKAELIKAATEELEEDKEATNN
jgi:hypothetical protein